MEEEDLSTKCSQLTVTGGMISRAEIGGGVTATRRADTCSTTGCPANDSDC
jgi:hypothetical protein